MYIGGRNSRGVKSDLQFSYSQCRGLIVYLKSRVGLSFPL